VLAAAGLVGCTDEPSYFDAGVDTVVVEVDFETGARPAAAEGTWRLADLNTRALLGGKTVVFPGGAGDVDEIPAGDHVYLRSEILAIAEAHRDQRSDAAQAAIYVVWLDGSYADNGVIRDDIVGIAIEDSGVIGIFAPQLAVTIRLLAPDQAAVAEQIALVHEIGHTLGLVDRGVEMQEDHRRGEDHCDNPACVMFDTGIGAPLGVALSASSDDGLVLFGQECLADARAARE
jgi:hypothetical protein